ncbi:MAG: hypothetical protein JKY37_27770, partial [Nannocystaceae bacterium]|nr:hypothetical protein [Nannocystaceae bacterium]
MHDTLELRSRIAVLAALSVIPVASACSTPTAPQPVSEAEHDKSKEARAQLDDGMLKREKYYREKARKEGKTFEEVAPARVVAAVKRREAGGDSPGKDDERRTATPRRQAHYADRDAAAKESRDQTAKDKTAKDKAGSTKPPGLSADEERFAPIDGDPPFIEGYNPEEASCPSGNWCASLVNATNVAVPNIGTHTLGCPERITGARAQDDPFPTTKAFKGLSTKPTMQGGFNSHGSELARERGLGADMCCYHWFEYCSGRPHLGDDGPLLAPTAPGRAWLADGQA